MKKFTSLLMLMFAFVASAWAEGLVVGKPYLIKAANAESALYLSYNGLDTNMKLKANSFDLFYLEDSETEGQFYLKTICNETLNYMHATSWNATISSNKTSFKIEPVEGKTDVYTLSQETADYKGSIGIDSYEDNASVYCNKSGEKSQWRFEPISTTDLKDIDMSKAYRIRSAFSGLYMECVDFTLTSGEGAFQLKNQSRNPGQFFSFESAEEDKYYLKIAADEQTYYVNIGSWNFYANSEAGVAFSIEEVASGVYAFNQEDGEYKGYAGNINSGSLNTKLYNNQPNKNGATIWLFEEVVETAVNVTYKYMINDLEYKSVVVEQDANSEILVPSQAYLDIKSIEGAIGEEDCVITVNCTENLPFIVSESIENPTWQVIDMHSSENNYTWKYVKDKVNNVELPVMSKTQSQSLGAEYYWAFVGNMIDGFKLYNKAAGSELTLRKAENGNTVSVMSDINDRNKFKLFESSAINGAFCFKLDGDDYYINKQGESGVNILKGWNKTDDGSSCRVFAPASFVLNALKGRINAPCGAVGSPKYLANEEIKSSLLAIVSAMNENQYSLEKLEELDATGYVAAVVESELIPYTDGYYRIYSAFPGLYAKNKGFIYDLTQGSPFRWGTIDGNNVNAIFKLITDNEKVVLQAVNTGMYMQGVAGAHNQDMTENGHIELVALGDAQYNLKYGNGTAHADGHRDGAGNAGAIISWGGGYGSASAWYLIPATEINITIGEAGYATTYLPFGVTLPNTVKAYAVTETSASTATMTEKGDIPANTGAILEGEGTHTLTIADATSDWEDNLLTGTNVTTELDGSAYILSAPQGKVGLYLTALKDDKEKKFQNKANKAYLPAGVVSAGVRSLVFNFGGGETAIESVEGVEDAKNAEIFDLAGRRVAKAQKGLYIVNGKKVIK